MRAASVVIPFPVRRDVVQDARSNVTWGGEWDRAKVEKRLIEAMVRTRRGIYSPGHGRFEVVTGERVGELELLEFAETRLPLADYRLLVAWADCQVRGRVFAEWCASALLSPERCHRQRVRAAEKLARLLSRTGVPHKEQDLTLGVTG